MSGVAVWTTCVTTLQWLHARVKTTEDRRLIRKQFTWKSNKIRNKTNDRIYVVCGVQHEYEEVEIERNDGWKL